MFEPIRRPINRVDNLKYLNDTITNIRYSKLDNPLCHIFKKNNLEDTLTGTLTTTRNSSATYVDMYGVLKTAANNVSRQEGKGWLFEGTSTNLLTYSNNFSNADWSQNDAGVILNNNYGISPDGQVDSTLFTQGVNNEIVGQVSPVLVGDNVTGSVWIKIVSVTGHISLIVGPNSPNIVTIPDDGDWHRVSVSNIATDVSGRFYIQLQNQGDSIEISRSQLETLPFASSYMHTTNTPVTRAADLPSFNGYNNMTSVSDSHSILMTINHIDNAINRFSRLLGVSDYNYYYLRTNPTTQKIDSVNGVSINTIPRPNLYSYNYAYTQDSGKLERISYVNGVGGVVNTSTTFAAANLTPDVPEKVVIGNSAHAYSTSEAFFGHISDFRIYDFALNAGEVRFLTGE